MKTQQPLTLFGEELPTPDEILKTNTCRDCIYHEKFKPEYSSKTVQCCTQKPSKRSNSGYITVKVTDKACYLFQSNKTN